jgi:NAD(P)-dependent dehydrogenase (short-subunit alcohol dehydrogenase family)
MMEIAGVSVLVTGGASGLGAATARHLASLGARIAILDSDRVRGHAVADEIAAPFRECNVADPASAETAIAEVARINGVARILVNCAGIGTAARIVGRDGPMPFDTFEQVIRVNLMGTFNMMRLAAAPMLSLEPTEIGERGVIISTASVAAFEGQIGQAAYAASKGGIVSLTMPAAREFAQFGVGVLTIAPGLFRTPLLEELPEQVRTKLSAAIPFPQRLGEPQEFAALVTAMVENPYLNGETVRLDGALRMQPR